MKSCFELAFEGKLEELRPLLAGNYQLRARDERGRTLLHVAAGSGVAAEMVRPRKWSAGQFTLAHIVRV